MAEVLDLARQGPLLHYRPWQGSLRGDGRAGALLFLLAQGTLLALMALLNRLLASPEEPANADTLRVVRLAAALLFIGLWGFVVRARAWPIARVSLEMIFRRKLFWAIYALAMMVFLLFFFGQYLMAWAASQIGEQEVRVGNIGRANPQWLVGYFRDFLKLNGSAEMFRNFFWYEGYCIMIVLALAGSVLIGNDIRHGSLAFYLSKPISRWDYLLGKGLAVAVFINLLTTVPAVVLFVQFGMLEDWEYFLQRGDLLVGILGYGMVLTVTMTSVLLAAAAWVRRTVPLIMTWTTLFFFCRLLSHSLVELLHLDPRWRLIDIWNGTVYLGHLCLGITDIRPSPQPAWGEAALVLGGVSLLCLSYLTLRIRGVEIVQ